MDGTKKAPIYLLEGVGSAPCAPFPEPGSYAEEPETPVEFGWLVAEGLAHLGCFNQPRKCLNFSLLAPFGSDFFAAVDERLSVMEKGRRGGEARLGGTTR